MLGLPEKRCLGIVQSAIYWVDDSTAVRMKKDDICAFARIGMLICVQTILY